MGIIIWAMTLTVVLGGVTVWLFDRDDFPNLGRALWWALQTVTTVGYGDVVPSTPVGRLIGAAIMVASIAFVSIFTAMVTSTLVERAGKQRPDEMEQRLAAIEASLRELHEKVR